MLSIQEVDNALKSNSYPYAGVTLKHNNYIYPLIVLKSQEEDFISLVAEKKLEVLDVIFGFDCGNLISQMFLSAPNDKILLTDGQLSELLFSLTDDELAELKLIPDEPEKFINDDAVNNFDYQNLSWEKIKTIINNINVSKLKKLGYQRVKKEKR